MVTVPWPLSNSPGRRQQEGSGRLINIFAEPRGEGEGAVWRRAPGASVFARTPSVGFAAGEADVRAVGQTLLSTFFELVGTSTFVAPVSTAGVALTYPTGTETGDVVFIAAAVGGNAGGTWPVTPGFTNVIESTVVTTAVAYSARYKACTGESTVTFVNPALGSVLAGVMFTLRGAMSSAPVCDAGTVTTGASGDPDPADVTATTANSLAVALGFLDDDAVTSVTAPTSFGSVLYNASVNCSVMVAFQPRPTTGSVTVSSFGTDGDDEWNAYSFTIRHD
jgi:hypothetical protein